MNLANAIGIEGWMNPPELQWLAEQASRFRMMVEVGCWKGRSTRVLADNTEGIIYAVDTWLGSEEHKDAQGNPPQGIWEAFYWNLRDYIENSPFKVRPLRGLSVDMAEMFPNGHFDMVFIDASHDYENVKADILAWKPKVKPGGIICGHDRGYPPVARAVQELLGTPGGETDIWVVNL